MESILSQSHRAVELIAVDDGSTDGSDAILDEKAREDARVRVIRRPNTGIVGALNDGLRVSQGELVARMDADDFCLPDRLEKQVTFMRARPECVALGTDVVFTDPEGAPLIRHYPALEHKEIWGQLLEGNGGAIIHPAAMFRRRAVEEVGGYRPQYQWVEDLDLYLRLTEVGELANLPEVHLHYRQHMQSVNHIRRNRDDLRRELVKARREALGLTPIIFTPSECATYRTADFRRHWAFDAARGGHWASARRNAARALLRAPFDLRNWRCFRYVWGASRLPLPRDTRTGSDS